MLFKRTPEQEISGRPWQADIDRVQQTLQDVLQAISQLSGVELPGVDPNSQGASGALPQLDVKTLKDRIRNDLEAFSVTTAAEVAKQAQEQTRDALGAVQNEMSGQIDQMAGELRGKLQARLEPGELEADLTQQSRERVAELVKAQTDEFARWVWLMCKGTGTSIPAQIESLLEPYVDEATAKFEGTFRQKVEGVLAEQEQTIQERVQGTIGTFESQISTFEQTAQEICERNADSVAQASSEKLNAAADEAAKNLAGRIQGETDGSLSGFQARLEEVAAASQEGLRQEESRRREDFRNSMEGIAGEVQEKSVSEISGRIAQTAADVIESSVQHLHQQAEDSLDHSKEELKGFLEVEMEGVRQQIHDLGWSTHESLSQDAARVAESLKGLDQELAGIRERHIAASEHQLSGAIREAMESLTGSIQQIAAAQLEQVDKMVRESQENAASQYESRLREVTESRYTDLLGHIQQEAGEAGARVAAEVKSTSESVMEELTNKVNASALTLREETARATARIESSVQASLENYRQQLAQITDSGLEERRQSIEGSIADLHNRLRQAADLLVPGDPVN